MPDKSPDQDGDKIRWGTIIPLIGGSAIGCKEATGNLPDFHLSYSPFAGNEKHIKNYWPSVPMYYLDKNAEESLPSFQNVDFINSVCPCAGLSMLNTASSGGKKRGADAAANRWMYESSVYVLSKVRPKVLWGENAPGLFTVMGQGVVEKLRRIGEHFGYSFSVMKTSTDLHGIPQRRVRTFYFFWKSPTVPKMDYYNRARKNLMEYLREIPEKASMQNLYGAEGKASERSRFYQFVLEKEGLTHAEFVKKTGKGTVTTYLEEKGLIDECIDWLNEKYKGESFWNKTGNNRTHVEYLEHVKRKREKGLGYWDDSPRFVGDTFAAVMKKTMMWAVHPEQDRFLNAREFAHLMGLPHDFEIDGEKSLNHIAQNVPTCTARDMAEQVKKFIRGELEMTEYSFLKQDNTTQTVVTAEEGSVVPVSDDQLNDAERNKILLELLSQSMVPTEDVKIEKKERKKTSKKVKTELSEEEKALLFIDAEIRREKQEKIKEEKRALREKERLLEKERRLEMKREKDSERLERLKQRQALAEQEKQLRREERALSLASRPTPVPLNPEEVEEEERKFMCYICKIFPRDDSRNKSELYRHYAIRHYPKELKKYLPAKGKAPCSLCPDGKLINSQAYSHIGQTHGKVEEFLPEEYHIKGGAKRRSSWLPSSSFSANELKPKPKDEVKADPEEVEDIISDDSDVEEEIEISEVKTRSGRVSKPTVIRSNGITISKVKPAPVMLISDDEEDSDNEVKYSQNSRKRPLPLPTQPVFKRTRFGRQVRPILGA